MALSDFHSNEIEFIKGLVEKMSLWVELSHASGGPYAKHRPNLKQVLNNVSMNPVLLREGEDRFVSIFSCYRSYRGKLDRSANELRSTVEAAIIYGLIEMGFDVYGLHYKAMGDVSSAGEGVNDIAVRLPRLN